MTDSSNTVHKQISICIPAYKNVNHLERLLHSIEQQTFRDFEVIITDDTPDESVYKLVTSFMSSLPVKYFKNVEPLGTPENWNEAIRKSKGKWIKIMHNDDWFTSPQSLSIFFEATKRYPNHSFFFTAFQNVTERTGAIEKVRCNALDRFFLRLSLLHLFKRVYVGNPSCTLIRNTQELFYDNRFKFVVDFEYYIRCIKHFKGYKYIDQIALNIGFHDDQVTKYTFLVPAVQVPENIVLYEKLGAHIVDNPVVYDYYWRMIRNLGLRSDNDIHAYYNGTVPGFLIRIIRFQSRISPALLRVGLISKMLMALSYLTNRIKMK